MSPKQRENDYHIGLKTSRNNCTILYLSTISNAYIDVALRSGATIIQGQRRDSDISKPWQHWFTSGDWLMNHAGSSDDEHGNDDNDERRYKQQYHHHVFSVVAWIFWLCNNMYTIMTWWSSSRCYQHLLTMSSQYHSHNHIRIMVMGGDGVDGADGTCRLFLPPATQRPSGHLLAEPSCLELPQAAKVMSNPVPPSISGSSHLCECNFMSRYQKQLQRPKDSECILHLLITPLVAPHGLDQPETLGWLLVSRRRKYAIGIGDDMTNMGQITLHKTNDKHNGSASLRKKSHRILYNQIIIATFLNMYIYKYITYYFKIEPIYTHVQCSR